jgi:transposase
MGRRKRPDGKKQITLFVNGKYRYAVFQDTVLNPKTGKYTHPKTIYGSVDEKLHFTPNARYLTLSEAERKKLLFPATWSIETVPASVPVKSTRGRPSHTGPSTSTLYGAGFFCEQVSHSCGLTDDLRRIFGEERAAEILSLAYYLLLHDDCYNHLESWQRVEWYPCTKVLTPSSVTRITQAISEDDKQSLFALRKRRIVNDSWCGIDSTSYSYYGHNLAESKFGHNKEHDKLPQVNQLVLYDMTGSMPVYYRRMPGNIPDTRTLRTTIKELELAGFPKAQLVLDRGYISAEGVELLVKKQVSFIMMAKTSNKQIRKTLLSLDINELCLPKNWIPEHGRYGIEATFPFSITVKGEKRDVAPLRLCIFFDPEQQGADRKKLAQDMHEAAESLDAIIEEQTVLDDRTVKKLQKFYTLTLDEKKHTLLSYTPDDKKMHAFWALSGFQVILCSRVRKKDYSLSYVLDRYDMRDEQEKCFMFIKSEQQGRRLRTSTELSTDGRIFIQFIALTLNSAIYRVYNSHEALKKSFATRKHMIEEMRSIRLIEHPKKAKIITEFVGKQVDICDAFGFEIPAGCRPSSKPLRKQKPGS